MAFAITNGNFGSASTWDNNLVPTGSEDAYANGFTIQVDGVRSLGRVRNDASDYYLPNTAIPMMTSATSPSGIVTTSSQVTGSEGWRAFDRNTSTIWTTSPVNTTTGTLSYQFTYSKIIKRYSFRANLLAGATTPRNFTFEASNDGSSWTTLDTQTAINVGAGNVFTSSLINTGNTAYLYYRINVTTVNGGTTIQICEFEMTELTSTTVGQITGGTFDLTNGSTLTCNASTGVVVGSTTPTITFALGIGNSATVNATIPSITPSNTFSAVLLSGLGTLNFTGDISCGPTSVSNLRVINITAAGTLNYNGNCTNGGNTTNQCNSIFSSAAATINIITTGFSGGNTLTQTNSSIFMNNGGNLFITSSGNITNGTSPAITIVGGVSLTIVGNVVGGSIEAIRNVTTPTANTTITGSVTAGSAANAIVALGLVRLNGLLFNTNRFMAVYSPQLTIENTTSSWTLQTFAGPNIVLYASGAALGQPTTNNVRFGTVYGATNEFIGTLRVPNPNTVLLGNLTDATVGTYIPSSPAQFVTELNTSTASVAVRLRNCATVATTGDQIASYNI